MPTRSQSLRESMDPSLVAGLAALLARPDPDIFVPSSVLITVVVNSTLANYLTRRVSPLMGPLQTFVDAHPFYFIYLESEIETDI